MFIDKDELNSLFARKYNIECLLEDYRTSDDMRAILKDELMDVEDLIKSIEKNNFITR